jgi:argininosuccinate lyase
VNKLVLQGIPFREAYKIIGEQIETGKFKPERVAKHSHEGSIGNLFIDKIAEFKNKKIESFHFEIVEKAINKLLL